MKMSRNRTKILQCLSPGKDKINNPLSIRLIRCITELTPMKLMKEIRALINLRWVSTHGDGTYLITETGKTALTKTGTEEIKYDEYYNRELFNENYN